MDVLSILGPGGVVAAKLPRYEERPQQRDLAAAVDRTMREGGRLLAEAGTGVGKSFAYLVPAIAAAADRGERVVIATHTIALQEQLLGKDVPFLSGILPAEFSVVLAKGRGNFLCLRRMNLSLRSGGTLFEGEQEERELARIAGWSDTTDDGSRQGLPFVPDGRVWSRVNAEAGNCMGRSCEFYERCFYQAGRRRIQNANILVANHHFLFADMALRKAGAQLLPDFQHLVLDEAHAVEEVAGEYLGLRVSRGAVHYVLRQLATPQGRGLLHAAIAPDEAIAAVGEARVAADAFFDAVDAWCRKGEPTNHRLTERGLFPLDAAAALDRLGEHVQDLARDEPAKDRAQEMTARGARCSDLADAMRTLVGLGREGHVHWAEPDLEGSRNTALVSAPVDVGPDLEEHLWSRLKGVVLTSATLSVGGEAGFRPLASRLGLGETEDLVLGSPFRWREQAKLLVDTTLPDPRAGDEYEDALPDAVLRHVARTQGHAFVLFTSFQSLERCHAACATALRTAGHTVLKQGEGLQRTKMLEEFRRSPFPVLFGTDSFWEGVDVPDNVLRNVIICRLPFAVPTHPLQEARTQAIRDRGGDAFGEYALPQAILKLKQGFGRLIRSGSDRGIVVVLDRRLATMRYGRAFLAALPDLPVEVLK